MFSLEKWLGILGAIGAAILGAVTFGYIKGRGSKNEQDAKATVKQVQKTQQAVEVATQKGQDYVQKVDAEPADDLSSFDN